METSTNSDEFKVSVFKRGEARPIKGFHLTVEVANLEEIERVSALYPVPYAGDEQPIIYIRRPVSKFMLEKPA